MCQKLLNAIEESTPTNPYGEKWKRGRPSKEQIEKRKMAIEWNQAENLRTTGNKYGLGIIAALMENK